MKIPKLSRPVAMAKPNDVGAKTAEDLKNGSVALNHIRRPELLEVAWHLGYAQEETRGKPVKELRQMISDRLTVASVPAAKLVATTTNAFKLPRLRLPTR